MTYRVIIANDALDQLRRHVKYIAIEQGAPQTALRWLRRALREVESLAKFPRRCQRARESSKSSAEIRILVVDRCLFFYRVDEADGVVRVLEIRHGSQFRGD